jgi:hypothetical protein
MTVQQMKVISLLKENQMLESKFNGVNELLKKWKKDTEKGQFINL